MNNACETIVSADQLAAELENESFQQRCVIIDCRFSLADTSQGEAHYAQSRIPKSTYAHLDKHLSSPIIAGVTGRHPLPDASALEAQFKKWGINNDSQIIAYDDKSGAIASRLWWLSRWLGHSHCAVLDGGFNAWKQSNNAIETSSPVTPIAGKFERGDTLMSVIEKQNVLDTDNCLIDAREPERYAGEHEPIDPVAGHIPGAVNAPFMQNVNPDGTFQSVEKLQIRFDKLTALAQNKQLVHYCGSGVTAAHNMLAMMVAQRDPGAMYAGSFSEWVSQSGEQFPVARLVD